VSFCRIIKRQSNTEVCTVSARTSTTVSFIKVTRVCEQHRLYRIHTAVTPGIIYPCKRCIFVLKNKLCQASCMNIHTFWPKYYKTTVWTELVASATGRNLIMTHLQQRKASASCHSRRPPTPHTHPRLEKWL